jgi:hypothetical protein
MSEEGNSVRIMSGSIRVRCRMSPPEELEWPSNPMRWESLVRLRYVAGSWESSVARDVMDAVLFTAGASVATRVQASKVLRQESTQ